MIPIITRIRAKSLSEFGDLVRHSGEEYIHVLEGTIIVHTEFYDPVDARRGRSDLHQFEHGPRLRRRRRLRRSAGARHLLERRRRPDEFADGHPRAARHRAGTGRQRARAARSHAASAGGLSTHEGANR